MRALLDTNAIIYLQKGMYAQALPSGVFAVSVISEIELLSFPGLVEEHRRWIERFLADVTLIELNEKVKGQTIALRREHHLRLPDAIIAASASYFGGVLLTNDKHFDGIPGLHCVQVPLRA